MSIYARERARWITRVVGALLTIVFATAVLLALFALSGCEGEPPHCPPPIGCAR